MKRAATTACLLLLCIAMRASSSPVGNSQQQAREVLGHCITAIGGIDRLRGIQTISYQSFAHVFVRSIDVSPSLPGMVAYLRYDVTLQPQRHAISEKIESWSTESLDQSTALVKATSEGGYLEQADKKRPLDGDTFYAVVDNLASEPISALLAAVDSPELSLRRDADGIDEISFHQTIYGQPVKTTLGIGRTASLEWIETEHSYAHSLFNSSWGTVAKRHVLSGWYIDPSGVHLPKKWKTVTNGLDESQQSMVNVKLNPSSSDSVFDIPSEFKGTYAAVLNTSPDDLAKANHGEGQTLDVAAGVVMLPGKESAYNSLIVKQEKGIVIVEGPYSNANSQYVIEYARKIFPSIPIEALITTNQLWFHVAGLAAYANAHVPIYALDSNADLVRRIIASQTKDQTGTSAPQLREVRDTIEIGKGTNRMLLVPFRGEFSARTMGVYFPELKLLYCSDIYLPQAWAGPYWTEQLAEIRDVIEREHLDVQRVSGVSMPPKDWKELSAAIPPAVASLEHKPS